MIAFRAFSYLTVLQAIGRIAPCTNGQISAKRLQGVAWQINGEGAAFTRDVADTENAIIYLSTNR
jgi:hypothetical protein